MANPIVQCLDLPRVFAPLSTPKSVFRLELFLKKVTTNSIESRKCFLKLALSI